MSRKKTGARDLKKQRWAAIVAAVLALGMLVSLVGVYLGQSAWGGVEEPLPPPDQVGPEDYLATYESEVERLENYLDEYEPTEAVLRELAENYQLLIVINQAFFDDNDKLKEYRERVVSIYRSLVEMDPDNLDYRLNLVYVALEADDRVLLRQEADALTGILRERPDPATHLSLVGLLSSAGEETLFDDEIEWLHNFLEESLQDGTAGSEERYYLALLLGEYKNDVTRAVDILKQIMREEDENSDIYRSAKGYLEYLQDEDSGSESAPE